MKRGPVVVALSFLFEQLDLSFDTTKVYISLELFRFKQVLNFKKNSINQSEARKILWKMTE